MFASCFQVLCPFYERIIRRARERLIMWRGDGSGGLREGGIKGLSGRIQGQQDSLQCGREKGWQKGEFWIENGVGSGSGRET